MRNLPVIYIYIYIYKYIYNYETKGESIPRYKIGRPFSNLVRARARVRLRVRARVKVTVRVNVSVRNCCPPHTHTPVVKREPG